MDARRQALLSKKKRKPSSTTSSIRIGKRVNTKDYTNACKAVFSDFKDVDFYSPKVKHVMFYADVSPESAEGLRKALYQVAVMDERPVAIHLHSRGGVGSLGITFANFIREIPVPVCCIVDGYACSAITPMLVSAPYRVMHQHSFVMIHEGSLVFASPSAYKSSSMDFRVNAMKRHSEQYRRIYSRYTDIPSDTLDDMLHRDLFMDCDTCLHCNVVDRVIQFDKKYMATVLQKYERLQGTDVVSLCDLRKNIRNWTTCNHVYTYNNDVGDNDANEGDGGAQLLNLVMPLQEYMDGPKAVIVHYNMFMLPRLYRSMDVAPLLVRICMSRVPVIGIIDTDIDLLHALPCIVSHRRYMYENVDLQISLVHDHLRESITAYYHDIKANIDTLRKSIRTILSRWTRLPQSMLDSLFDQRILLSAEDCLRYGIIDEILKPSKAHLKPKRSSPGAHKIH